jgi:NAD(P)-dependent dehydrogenase (short-subunit alcohol dehydrogenase family)
MNALQDRVAIVTGAGRGLGRAHALLLAEEGAKVVVNDLGSGGDGRGQDGSPATRVVEEIRAAGGEAAASTADVTQWDGARALIEEAISTFGRLDVLVNNAGVLRDSFLVSMSEQDWDAVISVHLKGHFAPTRFAAEYWRGQAKAGEPVAASVINTSSAAGLFGNPGQVNYGAAKAGIATLTLIEAQELGRYGVRVNAIAPVARTRLTEDVPGIGELLREPEDSGDFDVFDPANVAPLVAYLATAECPLTGQVYAAHGGKIARFEGWTIAETLEEERRLTIEDVAAGLPALGQRAEPVALF